MKDKSLWKKVIISRYGAKRGRWSPMKEVVGNESNEWCDILSVARTNPGLVEFFVSKCKIVVGDGCGFDFWHDRWLMDLWLKVEFPKLFRLSVKNRR